MSQNTVLIEQAGKVSYVTLNRADKRNAINQEMMQDAIYCLNEADQDTATSIIVLQGAGQSFCAGYDLVADLEGEISWRSDENAWREYLLKCLEFEMLPLEVSKPVVAAVKGYALGGGCELAMFCDLTVCSDDAMFGEPEIRFSNSGPAMIMPFIVGHKRARELLYTGDMIDAETALDCGMVNRVFPVSTFHTELENYVERLSLIDPQALHRTKQALRQGIYAAGIPEAMRKGVEELAVLYATETEFGTQFNEIIKQQGLKSALSWRMSQFR